MASFAEKLKALRGQNHMTQAQLAAALNVARSTVAGYETKSREPSHDKLNFMADLFHVSVDYLLDDSPVEITTFDEPYTSQTEALLLTRYRKLSLQSKKELLHYLELLESWESTSHLRIQKYVYQNQDFSIRIFYFPINILLLSSESDLLYRPIQDTDL